MGSHRCIVISLGDAEECLLATTLQLLHLGRKVLVVHGGAMQGARMELALRQALGLMPSTLMLVHRSGSPAEFARSLSSLDPVEGGLEVLLLQSGSEHDGVEVQLLAMLAAASSPDWTLTCLYDLEQALDTALGQVLAHEAVRVRVLSAAGNAAQDVDEGATVVVSSDAARLLTIDLLLQHAESVAQVEQAARATCLRALDPELVRAVLGLHLARLAPVAMQQALEAERVAVRRAVADLEEGVANVARHQAALQLCDGELFPLLRAGAGLAGYRLLLENADFTVFRWSDEPRPPPPALSSLLTPSRIGRLSAPLRAGVPHVVRLGTPAAGTRIVMRLGHRRVLGYLSVLDSTQVCPPQLVQLLQQLESPLVTALRYEQGVLRLSQDSRAQVLHDLFTGSLTAAEELQAAAFTGWPAHERRRVACILPRQRPAADRARAEAAALNALRISAEGAGYLASVVGSGVAVLSPDGDRALQALTEWLVSAGPYTLGFSEPIQAPSEVALAMRQSQWTAHLARTTGRSVLDFGRLGFDRLLFPSVDVEDIDLTRPLRQLRGETAALGFDPAETLEAFLDAAGNIRDASRRLHVHPNTLRYRLGRIEATCGLELDDPHCRFDLQLAFRQEASWRVLRGEA